MQAIGSKWRRLVLQILACLLILKVTLGVVMTYGDYIPPSFDSAFLNGRDAYFWGGYHWAFYAHIVSGPCALVFGTILLSDWFRLRFSKWHRRLGRVQAACVLLLVAPSGFWMAFHAETGAVAGAGFASLALATGLCVFCGFRAAVRRRFAEHRRWMWRCYLLLCSAVVLRLTAGVATVAGIEGPWTYTMAAWTSWLVPLGVFEALRLRRGSKRFWGCPPQDDADVTDPGRHSRKSSASHGARPLAFRHQ
jgi:hypothetical protein